MSKKGQNGPKSTCRSHYVNWFRRFDSTGGTMAKGQILRVHLEPYHRVRGYSTWTLPVVNSPKWFVWECWLFPQHPFLEVCHNQHFGSVAAAAKSRWWCHVERVFTRTCVSTFIHRFWRVYIKSGPHLCGYRPDGTPQSTG